MLYLFLESPVRRFQFTSPSWLPQLFTFLQWTKTSFDPKKTDSESLFITWDHHNPVILKLFMGLHVSSLSLSSFIEQEAIKASIVLTEQGTYYANPDWPHFLLRKWKKFNHHVQYF